MELPDPTLNMYGIFIAPTGCPDINSSSVLLTKVERYVDLQIFSIKFNFVSILFKGSRNLQSMGVINYPKIQLCKITQIQPQPTNPILAD
jgi:hypothetical protein